MGTATHHPGEPVAALRRRPLIGIGVRSEPDRRGVEQPGRDQRAQVVEPGVSADEVLAGVQPDVDASAERAAELARFYLANGFAWTAHGSRRELADEDRRRARREVPVGAASHYGHAGTGR